MSINFYLKSLASFVLALVVLLPLQAQTFSNGFKFKPGVTEDNYQNTFTARKVATAPNIDGQPDDAAWAEVPWTSYQIFRKGSDANATEDPIDPMDYDMEFKAVWDDNTLYFLIHVKDDVISYRPDGNWWWQDAIEFYVRGAEDIVAGFSRDQPGQTSYERFHPDEDNLLTSMNNADYTSQAAFTVVPNGATNDIYYEYQDADWSEMLLGMGITPTPGDSIRFAVMANEDDDVMPTAETDTERDNNLTFATPDEPRFTMDNWPVLRLADEDGVFPTGGDGGGDDYTGQGYAGEIIGRAWDMPAALVDSTTGIFTNSRDLNVVDAKLFDVVDDAGPDFAMDTAMTFGIYPPADGQMPSDGGGQEVRGYVTNGDPLYTPIRWNGGVQGWRQGGNWARYTVNMPEGSFHLVYRGDVRGFAQSNHKFDVNIYSPDDLNTPVWTYTVDLTDGFPETYGAVENDVLNLGGGNEGSDWLRILVPVNIAEAGDYVVEMDQAYFPYGFTIYGGFTFNFADDYPAIDAPYAGRGFAFGVADSVWSAPGPELAEGADGALLEGTIDVRWFDVVLDTADIAADTAVVFGIYPPSVGQMPTDRGGQNTHNYTTQQGDSLTQVTFQPLRWNGGPLVWRGGGKWTRYTVNFQDGRYKYNYRADTRGFVRSGHKYTLRIFDPTNMVFPIFERVIDLTSEFPADSTSVANGIENLGGGNAQTDWMRLQEDIIIPTTGNYIVEIDEGFFTYGPSILGEINFNSFIPTSTRNNAPVVRNVFKVFPNPTQNLFRVEALDKPLNGRLDLYSAEGRQIKSVTVENALNVDFDLAGLPNGMYVLRMLGDGGLQTRMVIKSE